MLEPIALENSLSGQFDGYLNTFDQFDAFRMATGKGSGPNRPPNTKHQFQIE